MREAEVAALMATEPEPLPGSQIGVAGREALMRRLTPLLEHMRSGKDEELKAAASELRLLAKWDMNNRVAIGEAGGIPVIFSLLSSRNAKVQENAVTTLLNLSIYPPNRQLIMETKDGVRSITSVLRDGRSWAAKENTAALLSSLLTVEENRSKIGANSDVLTSLRDLLRNGRMEGKKDAIAAIFHLALWPENRGRLVGVGVISPLRVLLVSSEPGVVEDALSTLSQLARCPRGTDALKDPQIISSIVDILQHGSRSAKANATSLLLAMSHTGGPAVDTELRRHSRGLMGVLCNMLTTGTARGKAKANELIQIVGTSGPYGLNAAYTM